MKNSLYHKFYKNFFLVMILPFSILFMAVLLFNSYMLLQNVKSLSNNIGSILEKEVTFYTKQLNGCRSTLANEASSLSLGSDIDPYSKFKLIRQLNGFKDILGYCRNVGIIDMENSSVLSSDGNLSLTFFFENENPEFIQGAFELMDGSYMLYPYQTQHSINFLYMAGQKNYPNSFLFFTFDSNHLYYTISDILNSNNSFIFLENPVSGEIFALNELSDMKTKNKYIQCITDFPKNSDYDIDAAAFISRYSFPEYNSNFYVFTPFSSMKYTLLMMLVTSLGILLLFFCMGLFLVHHMATINYTPIRKISELIPPDHLLTTENELSQIDHALVHMNEKISSLSEKISENQENIKKSILTKLLYQQYPSEQAFLEEARIINIQHLYSFFTVFVLGCETRENTLTLHQYFNGKRFQDCQYFLLNSLEMNRLILVFNFLTQNSFSREIAKTIYHDSSHTLGIHKITIGVSLECLPFDQIPCLYEQATQAIDYSFVTGKYTITFFSDFEPSTQISQKPLPKIDYIRLEKCILDYDDAKLLQIFYEIFEELQLSSHSLNNIKIYLFDMFRHICNMLVQLNIPNYQVIDNEITSIFMDSDSLEELFNLLYAIILEISKNLHTISDEDKIDLIRKYIYEHLCDTDFCVNSISDYFHISLPTLSRFYKQKTGQNISLFINDLKIEKTKDLLIHSNHSIEYIVEEMGYSNTSSFIRKFKSIVGMTPGQYRQLHKSLTGN